MIQSLRHSPILSTSLLTCEVKMIQSLRHMPILSTSLLTCEVKMIQPLRHIPILSTSLIFTSHVNNEVDNISMCRKG
jgi:hypothetical protein